MEDSSYDSRDVLRGGCSLCGCAGYDGGKARKKCVDCGHPPGKHQNLTVCTPTKSSAAPSAKKRTLAVCSSSSTATSTSFSIGPPTTPRSICQYPGCGKKVYFDLNTSCEHSTCKDHLDSELALQSLTGAAPSLTSDLAHDGDYDDVSFDPTSSSVPSLLPTRPSAVPSVQSTPSLPQPFGAVVSTDSSSTPPTLPPPGQRCKVKGCTRPRYQEPGPNGKQHEFCGIRHAQLYQRQQAATSVVDPSMKCKTPDCPRQKRPLDNGSGYYDYCSITCRNGKLFLPSASAPSLTSDGTSDEGTCSLPGCYRPKYTDPANGRVHDYCGRSHAALHASLAQQQGVVVNPPVSTLGIRPANPQELSSVQAKFQQNWATRKSACPSVECVFVITNHTLQTRWQTYHQTLSSQAIEEHYHGTKVTCDIVTSQTLCTSQDCGVCGISSMGFDRRCIRKNINFQRFGHGFYLALNSSKCHDYTQGIKDYRAMLLCDVSPGNKYTLLNDDQTLKSPPQGYDSVHGQPGGSLNYEEIVLYQPDAILPRYIIVYKRGGIGKIAT